MRCLWVTEFLCLSDDWAGPAKQTKPCSWMGHQLGKPAESSWLGSLSAWHRAIVWALELAMWSNQGCPRQPKRKTSRSTPRQRAILGDNSVGLLHNCQDHPHVQWICAKQWVGTSDPICSNCCCQNSWSPHPWPQKTNQSKDGKIIFKHFQPTLGLFLKLWENFLSPSDWAMILLYKSSFSVPWII